MRLLQRFPIPVILFASHATLFALTWLAVSSAQDPEAGMAWIFIYYVDWPLSKCFDVGGFGFEVPLLVLATIQWLIVGAALQSMWSEWKATHREELKDDPQ